MSSRAYNKDTGKYDLIKEDWRNAKVIVGRAGIRAYPEYLVNDNRLTEGYFRAPDGTLFDASQISLCHVVIDEHGNNVAAEWWADEAHAQNAAYRALRASRPRGELECQRERADHNALAVNENGDLLDERASEYRGEA